MVMGYGELEVEVTIANSGKRRRLWIAAVPGVRPGRRVRFTLGDTEQWWRIVEVGHLRLREAAPIELVS